MAEKSVIINPEYENILNKITKEKESLTEAIMTYDDLVYHECRVLEMEYMLKFGVYENKKYEIYIKTLRIKRKIELLQASINKQEPLDIDAAEKRLDIEFEEYQKKIQENFNKMNDALKLKKDARLLTEEESKEMHDIYKKLAMKLHPDMNTRTTENEKELFLRTIDAYRNGDLEALKTIEVLARDEKEEMLDLPNSMELLKETLKNLEYKTQSIYDKIIKVKGSFPYNKRELLADPEACAIQIKEHEASLEQYKQEYEAYERKLDTMVVGTNERYS